MGSDDVLEVMHRLLMKHGKPEFIRSDNGGEFVAQHLQDWLRKVGVRPIQIYPGSPWENGYNERFNGILRQELLNTEWFHSVKQAQVAINIWLKEYNHIRPHHALGMRPPVPETFIRETRNLWYRNWGLDRLRREAAPDLRLDCCVNCLGLKASDRRGFQISYPKTSRHFLM